MGRENYKALIWLICCCFASCVKDKPVAVIHKQPDPNGNIYVACEGRFMYGEATLYAYHPADSTVYGDLFNSVNNQSLGDVFQSMGKIGDKLFLCINNSDKVVVLNATNWKLVTTISIPKPRYILPISDTKAYISSEYRNKVYIINPQTQQVTDSITFQFQNTEGMCLLDNYAFICAWDTACNCIYKVDVTSDKIVQTIQISGYAPQSVLQDKEQMLWVLSGNKAKGKPGALTRIDPLTGFVLGRYPFAANVDAMKPVFNAAKDTLYFIEVDYNGGTENNGIYRIGIHESGVPAAAFIAAQHLQYFYGLGLDPVTGYIYACDPKGFNQNGTVYIYRQDGTQVRKFDVGVGPGQFYFDE